MDDLSPNNGAWFQPSEPEAQVKDREKEKAKVLGSLKLIEEMLVRLDKEITRLSSIDSIPSEHRTTPEEFMHHFEGNEVALRHLKKERGWLKDLKDTYKT